MGAVDLTMRVKTFLLLVFGVALTSAGPGPALKLKVQDRQQDVSVELDLSNEPRNPGKPLGPKDFHLASQLPAIPPNMTTEAMMRIVEDGELKGSVNNPEPDLADVLKVTKNGIHALENHWGSAIIPYTLDAAFSDSDRAVIAQGIAHVEENSCLRFVPRAAETDYVQIWPGDSGCYAVIPYRIGSGMREVGLALNGCMYMKIVVHELLHVVGVKHEQCRADRDDYIDINWSNIQDGGPSQYYKDNWVGGAVPTNICKETLDYANCRSTYFTTACDLPYDYTSVMHYSARSFAIDDSQDVMTAKDGSMTTLGNTELSELDKQKLQCLYQCDGTAHSNCGGHFFAESGTFMSDGTAGCQWLVRAPVGKGIILDFSTIPAGVSCADFTIEVRKGVANKADGDGPLFGSYCSTSSPLVIATRSAGLNIKVVMTAGAVAKGATFGTWTTEDLTCCDNVMVENFDGQTSRQGLFAKMSGTTQSDLPVYQNGDQYLWFLAMSQVWVIGGDYTGNSIAIQSVNGDYCPEDGAAWQYYDGGDVNDGWADDADATARCSDCALYPANSECITCCDSLSLTTAADLGGYAVFAGSYSLYSTTPSYNDQKVYKLDGQDYCLYFTDCGNWYVTDCSSVGSGCGGYVWSSSGVGCAHDSARTWDVGGGQGTITDMKAVCSGECADDSPAAPTGATASNIGKTAGHIVTYICDSGSGESKAICDAATLVWKPTSIPSDLCSTAAPAPSPVTAAPSPVTAAPSPVTAAPGATPCQQKNKIPVLKGAKKKKVKKNTDCQALCTDCMRWNYKTHKKAGKRICYLLSVTYGNKKGYTSGERVASCGTGPIAMGDTIMKNKQTILKNLKVIKKVKKADDCSDKCTDSNDCQYYKWLAKKKMCYLMKLSTKTKKGYSTA